MKSQFELILSTFGSEIQAKQDANEFKTKTVFTNRSAVFPNPRNYRVTPKTIKTEVYKEDKPRHPMYPWRLKLTIDVEGDNDANVNKWIAEVKNKARIL